MLSLEAYLKRRPAELSGGMRQRVAVARAKYASVVVGPQRGHSEPTDRVIQRGDVLRTWNQNGLLALGAFFAGMVMSSSTLSQQAMRETLPLRDAFAVLFFVSVGMLFDPSVIVERPLQVLGVVAVIVVGKSIAALALVLALAVTGPLLAPGYLLLRDAVSTPRSYLSDAALGLSETAPRALPQDFALALASQVLDGGVVVKALLVAGLWLAGCGAARLAATVVPERRELTVVGSEATMPGTSSTPPCSFSTCHVTACRLSPSSRGSRRSLLPS